MLCLPLQVTIPGMFDVRFTQVSCGPFHTAAVTTDGLLFSWGDGLFGKLGYGDQASCSQPRQVRNVTLHMADSNSLPLSIYF